MRRIDIAMNVILYQCAWFAGVLGAAAGNAWLYAGGVAAALLWHLFRAPEPLREVRLIVVAAGIGAAVDSVIVASGWVRMEGQLLMGGFLPLWMVALWAAFATTLNVSLRAFRNRYALASFLALIGAPLAYIAGARLGALEWVMTVPALALIGVAWALSMPLLLHTARRHDGYRLP